jgi:hypothetical protein
MQVVMIITINNPSNSKILGSLHSQLMGLLTITVSPLPLATLNRDRVMVRKAMVHIMRNNNQDMLSHKHMSSNKVMAQLPAMVVGVTQLKKGTLPTMDHKEIQPKLPNPLPFPSKAMLPPTNKELLNQVMGLLLPRKLPMAINHSLVMDLVMVPLHLKSQVELHLFMVNHSRLAQQEAMVSQHILPSPHLLVMLSQS